MKLALVLGFLALVVGVFTSKGGNASQDCSSQSITLGPVVTSTVSLVGSGVFHPDTTESSAAITAVGSNIISPDQSSTTTLQQSTHAVTRLPPGRRDEEATSTHFATIGGPGPVHLTFVHHTDTRTTVDGTMTIQTSSLPSTTLPSFHNTVPYQAPPVRREETATISRLPIIGGPNHLTFVPHTLPSTTLSAAYSRVPQHNTTHRPTDIDTDPPIVPSSVSFTRLSAIHNTTYHHTTHEPTNIETDRHRQAIQTHPAGMPNPLDPVCSQVCRPYFTECLQKCNFECFAECRMNTCLHERQCGSKCGIGYDTQDCKAPPHVNTSMPWSFHLPPTASPHPPVTLSVGILSTLSHQARDVAATWRGGPPVITQKTTTLTGRPRDTLTGPAPTDLTTFSTSTVTGSLETVPGHSRDTVTGPDSDLLTLITESDNPSFTIQPIPFPITSATTSTTATTLSGPH